MPRTGPGPTPSTTNEETPVAITTTEIHRRFPPPPGDPADPAHVRRAEISRLARCVATQILTVVPGSREQTLAITALEEAVMWAHAGIARRTPAGPWPLGAETSGVEEGPGL